MATVAQSMTAGTRDPNHPAQFRILDIPVSLSVDDPDFARVTWAFMGAYAPDVRASPAIDDPLQFVVRRVSRLPPRPPHVVGVHRTKHPYWNINGYTDATRRHHLWPTRGIALERTDRKVWRIDVGPGVEAVFAAEAIFHAVRSLALYHRPIGNLLHGSAVAIEDNVVALVGPSMAGKTTLMTRLLAAGGCVPFANDRLLVLPGADLPALSWPSYASFCEGHLLGDRALAAAARAYESDDCPYRTRSWGAALEPVFDKAGKRTYPMRWLRDVYGLDYRSQGRLAAIVCCRVSPEIERPTLAELAVARGPARARALTLLCQSAFDTEEPSFLPWHGMPLPGDAPDLGSLLDRLVAADGKVLAIEAPVTQLDESVDRLREAILGKRG